MKKVLVIAAHPDDEVLGMGGTVAKLTAEGTECYLLIVTDGSSSQYRNSEDLQQIIENKKKETKRCADILGFRSIHYGELPDMKLDCTPHIGINSYWLEHLQPVKTGNVTNILYIGRFDNNKNVHRLTEAFLRLKEDLPDIHLTLVGGKGEQEEMVKRLAAECKDAITYLGPIYDKDELRKLMRQSAVFAMTSIFETFGLVYVEALSQGLPILYTKGQGVDGFFAEDIGVAVNPKDTNDIVRGLRELIIKHDKYQGYNHVDFEQFRWHNIARKYKDIIFNMDYESSPTLKSPITFYSVVKPA